MLYNMLRAIHHFRVCCMHVFSITIHWKHKNGEIKTTTAKVGMNLLEAARLKDIDLEGN
jgi:hypothetical protein